MSIDHDRRSKRLKINVPLKVYGMHDSSSSWTEMTNTLDLSSFGARFVLENKIETGRLLQLILAMPQQLRAFDFLEPQYKVWSIVITCEPFENEGKSEIGVAFLGKNPPASYLERPETHYEITKDEESGSLSVRPASESPKTSSRETSREKVERAHSRYDIPISIELSVIDKSATPTVTETTVTENISLGGASIFSSIDPPIGTKLQVKSEQYGADLPAIVRGKRTGDDGIPRLHVEFVDGLFPLKGIVG